jgi:LysR family transcriptional regulator, glycine cleavage system transcriptional activator
LLKLVKHKIFSLFIHKSNVKMNPRKLTPSMSLLLAFDASARHLSFTRAAQDLYLTQSAISRQVQALETLLDVPLFVREQRKISLTGAGATYHREVSVALQRIRSGSLQAIASRSGSGSLHLAALPTFASKWLLPRLNDFYLKNPGVLVHVHSRIGQFDLDQAGIDAAISSGDGTWPGLVSHHLMDEILLPVISPNLRRECAMHSPADISQHLLLVVATRSNAWFRWFEQQGLPNTKIRLGPQFELTSHLIQAVTSGIGVGLLPSFLVKEELQNGSLELAFDLPLISGYSYYLHVRPEQLSLPSVSIFSKWMIDQVTNPFLNSPPLIS